MTYAELLTVVVSVTGSFSFDFEGTGYLFEFDDEDTRDTIATEVIRGGASVERRGDKALFVQL